jgi:uncharacterized protein YjbI with pentapeptide repeats
LNGSTVTNANLTNANLTNANFTNASLTNATFTGAIVKGVNVSGTTGFTASQLYSTASYASGDLSGIAFSRMDLTGGNFAGFSLINSSFGNLYTGAVSTLTNVNFTNANLTNASLSGANLYNAVFTGAIIKGADFNATMGFTASQLYSTASYASGDLTGIGLEHVGLNGWNFANQNLTNANFYGSALTNANFTNANLTDAVFHWNLLAYHSNINFTGADLRGAIGWSPDSTTITHNTIRPDGSIQGLALLAGEKLVIRNNPLPITVTTSATMDPAATLQFLLEDKWTSPIGFNAGLTPTLGGTLDLELADAIDPKGLLGETFQLFSWNGSLPPGDQFAVITTEPGLTFDLSNLYSTGTVSLIAVPEPSPLLLAGLASLATFGLLVKRKLK